ncbi:MAG: S8 family peptidase [Fluviicola sp.]|nr:S8 family peptidase [Fluviicola sp.]
MKQLYLIILLIISSKTFGQNDLILKFRPELIEFLITEDFTKKEYTFEELLNDEGDKIFNDFYTSSNLSKLLSKKQTVFKVFENISWKDSLSITRFGDTITLPPFWSCFVLEQSGNLELEKIRVLLIHSNLFQYVEYSFNSLEMTPPNDEFYTQQYSLNFNPSIPEASINIEEAWEMETGKPYIKISVLDSGIDTLHPDLNVLYGANYHRSVSTITGEPIENWGASGGRHGVPVAGIIAGKRDNTIGVSGIAGGSDSTAGVSLIDQKLIFDGDGSPAHYRMAAVVDAARSVGTYWNYGNTYSYSDDSGEDQLYFTNAPGFGVHAQNHSYIIYTNLPINIIEGKDIGDPNIEIDQPCQICREALLFSLKSGVINVVARGNSGIAAPNPDGSQDLGYVANFFPQNMPDNWIISVGASGYDGTTLTQGVNQGYWDATGSGMQSLRGGNMDIIAPGSDSIVYTSYIQNGNYGYRWFNGTSAAAPHATGVVGLLLSHYNRECYHNQNLTIEDIEYILEESATDISTPGYDYNTANGRLNAGKAMQMVDYPKKQFVHPTEIVNTTLVERDTIALHYKKAISNDSWGPISSSFAPRQNKYYQVERLKYQTTYDYSDFILPSTEIIATYPLPSRCNSLNLINDTFNNPSPGWIYDVFEIDPHLEIVQNDTINHLVTTQGYYYHFINTYFDINDFTFTNDLIDYWYPVNPQTTQPKMPVSIYLSDTTLLDIWGSNIPCDSINLLYDSTYLAPTLNYNQQIAEQIVIYPNPSTGELKMYFPSAEKRTISVHNTLGEEVAVSSCETKIHQLNLTFLPAGTFIITVGNEQSQKRIKWVKL